MRIKITPAIMPEHRHAIEKLLGEAVAAVGRVDGGGMPMDGTSCDVFIYPKEGFTEMDIRTALAGRPEEPPWPLPEFNPDKLPTAVPETA